MKKLVIASLLFTGSVYADDFKPWTIFASTFSSNYTLPSRFENVQLAYKAGVQYNVNENLYMQANSNYYPSTSPSSWGFAGLVGVAASHGLLRPYGELSVNFLHLSLSNRLTSTRSYNHIEVLIITKCCYHLFHKRSTQRYLIIIYAFSQDFQA